MTVEPVWWRRLWKLLRHQHDPRREFVVDKKGRSILHFVCDCGYNKPVIDRTEEELERMYGPKDPQ